MIELTVTQLAIIILIAVLALIIMVLQLNQHLNNIIENGISSSTALQITDDDLKQIVDFILEELEKKKSYNNAEDSK